MQYFGQKLPKANSDQPCPFLVPRRCFAVRLRSQGRVNPRQLGAPEISPAPGLRCSLPRNTTQTKNNAGIALNSKPESEYRECRRPSTNTHPHTVSTHPRTCLFRGILPRDKWTTTEEGDNCRDEKVTIRVTTSEEVATPKEVGSLGGGFSFFDIFGLPHPFSRGGGATDTRGFVWTFFARTFSKSRV